MSRDYHKEAEFILKNPDILHSPQMLRDVIEGLIGKPSTYDWMEEARGLAAQCWCDPETEHKEMDVVLAEAVARRIAAWMTTAAFHARNEEYWRERTMKAEFAKTY